MTSLVTIHGTQYVSPTTQILRRFHVQALCLQRIAILIRSDCEIFVSLNRG